jgi:hypothetical protein
MGCRIASQAGSSAQRAEEAIASRVPDTSLRLEHARPGVWNGVGVHTRR